MKEAYLAAGSFWEAQLSLDGIPGVLMTKVGYMGGFVPFPTYTLMNSIRKLKVFDLQKKYLLKQKFTNVVNWQLVLCLFFVLLFLK